MRVFVFFDLPVKTMEQRRAYTKFRKLLIKNGFMMLQESVYCKMVQNSNVVESVQSLIHKNHPEEGLVQLLTVTERQYQKMDFIVGEAKNELLDTDERLVIF